MSWSPFTWLTTYCKSHGYYLLSFNFSETLVLATEVEMEMSIQWRLIQSQGLGLDKPFVEVVDSAYRTSVLKWCKTSLYSLWDVVEEARNWYGFKRNEQLQMYSLPGNYFHRLLVSLEAGQHRLFENDSYMGTWFLCNVIFLKIPLHGLSHFHIKLHVERRLEGFTHFLEDSPLQFCQSMCRQLWINQTSLKE